jgi:hypothetical protein
MSFNNDNMQYNDFLERLKIEFSDFLRYAEAGRTTRHASLKARKQSMFLRKLLKEYRNVAIKNDNRISMIMQEAKRQIEELDS